MDKRGFDRDPASRQHQAMMAQKALEMEEALYLQRQQELDRDIQLQRLLIQEQLQKEAFSNAAAASLHASRLYFGGGLAAQYGQELMLQQQQQQQQEQLRRQHLHHQLQGQPHGQSAAAAAAALDSEPTLEQQRPGPAATVTAARAPAPNPSQRKRSFDQVEQDLANAKKAARSESTEKAKGKSKVRKNSISINLPQTPAASVKTSTGRVVESSESAAIEALTAVGDDLEVKKSSRYKPTFWHPVEKGTVDQIIAALESEMKADVVATAIANLKKTVSSGDLDQEEFFEEEEVIEFRAFRSALPLLPKEPEDTSLTSGSGFANGGKRPEKPALTNLGKEPPLHDEKAGGALLKTVDYPYPVDSWWPSIAAIRKESRSKGERTSDEDGADEPILSSETNVTFKGKLPEILRRLSKPEPGVLEKVPHCKVHRMAMRSLKVASAPDHAFCWQVTENYCNKPMVCCSICSTWRHAACGGHYEPYTAKQALQKNFVPVCDRCHAEQTVLGVHVNSSKQLERQRIEHLRRGLFTSQIVRHAAFGKHGGPFKWPLGSVAQAQIGGHTRSVHSRHDKAEKQWSEMVTRLGRGSSSYGKKERVKIRTRELERVLVSVEDAEGYTDRHNMMLFLARDSTSEKPVGYENSKINLFDPEDDDDDVAAVESEKAEYQPETEEKMFQRDDSGEGASLGRRVSVRKPTIPPRTVPNQCCRSGCENMPRFDSLFCSDACGVSALEADLLRSIECALDIHPSQLRAYA